jgi:hypothetical protein
MTHLRYCHAGTSACGVWGRSAPFSLPDSPLADAIASRFPTLLVHHLTELHRVLKQDAGGKKLGLIGLPIFQRPSHK